MPDGGISRITGHPVNAKGSAIARCFREPVFLIACAFALLVAWQRQPRFFHAEPVIELHRFLDPFFLTNDFFSNTLDGYHYQYFFTLLNGAVVWVFGVSPEVALSLMAYIAVTGASAAVFYAGFLLNGRSLLAGAVTSLFVGATLFALGNLGPYLGFARPWAFVQPLVVIGMALTCVRRPVAAILWLGVASLFHPLVGAVMGAVCLFASWADIALIQKNGAFVERFFPRPIIMATAIFLIFLSPNLAYAIQSWSQFRLPDPTFVDITIFYRHPEHYVTAFWATQDVAKFAFGILAGGAALLHPGVRSICTRPMALIIAGLFAILMAAFLLIEIFPTRLGASLMGYRFNIQLHFILVLLAGRFAFIHATPAADQYDRFWAYLMIFAFLGVTESYAVFFVFAASLLALRIADRSRPTVMWLTGAALAIMAASGIAGTGNVSTGHLAAALVLIGALECLRHLSNQAIAAAAAVAIFALAGTGLGDAFHAPERTATREPAEHDIARAAGAMTGRDAIFVTPPGLELLRTVARRAIVVGYEFPFLDKFIEGWNERAKTIWGADPLYYPHAIEAYRTVSDDRLGAARRRFNASHAILFSETVTAFGTVYDNGKYKIIRLK